MKKSGVLVYNHKPRRKGGRLIHPFEWFARVPELTLMEEVIWNRGSTHNHCNRLMWPHTERLYVFRRTDGKYTFQNTGNLDFRSDVWCLSRGKTNGHNAPFPLVLAEAVINAWSSPGDLVLDPYCGSGTTAVAARGLGRAFLGAEVLKKYHKLATQRLSERSAV